MTEHDDRSAGEYREPDALDRLIAEAARDYHTPPPGVPREAMWAAIVAARPAGAPVVPHAAVPHAAVPHAAASIGTRVVALDAERARRRGAWRLAAAAAIFLTTGVGIGRWWSVARPNAPAPVAGPQTAAANTAPSSDVSVAPDVPVAPTVLAAPLAEADAARRRGASGLAERPRHAP